MNIPYLHYSVLLKLILLNQFKKLTNQDAKLVLLTNQLLVLAHLPAHVCGNFCRGDTETAHNGVF